MEILIKDFWKWFSTLADRLATDYENKSILDTLNKKVLELGDFSWELGAGVQKENAFTISPNGDPDLLKQTKLIISLAPEFSAWELYSSKQPKQWELLFEIELESKSIIIDANKWKYVLFKFPDQTFDILIECLKLFELDEDNRIYAVEIALDGVIGEEERINRIGNIEVVSNADKYASRLTEFKDLKMHLQSLL